MAYSCRIRFFPCRPDTIMHYRAGDEDPAELSDLDHWGDSVKGARHFTFSRLLPFHLFTIGSTGSFMPSQ
jgi:hypothetical protein